MPTCCNRCPNRARCRRSGTFPASAAIAPPSQCIPEDTGAELYSGVRSQPVPVLCNDPYCASQAYDARTRCSYWPSFCHPRWLRCRDLYGRKL